MSGLKAAVYPTLILTRADRLSLCRPRHVDQRVYKRLAMVYMVHMLEDADADSADSPSRPATPPSASHEADHAFRNSLAEHRAVLIASALRCYP